MKREDDKPLKRWKRGRGLVEFAAPCRYPAHRGSDYEVLHHGVGMVTLCNVCHPRGV